MLVRDIDILFDKLKIPTRGTAVHVVENTEERMRHCGKIKLRLPERYALEIVDRQLQMDSMMYLPHSVKFALIIDHKYKFEGCMVALHNETRMEELLVTYDHWRYV